MYQLLQVAKKQKKPSERFLFLTGERTRIENAWTNQPPLLESAIKLVVRRLLEQNIQCNINS